MQEKIIRDYLENKITFEEFTSNVDDEMIEFFENKTKTMTNEMYKKI